MRTNEGTYPVVTAFGYTRVANDGVVRLRQERDSPAFQVIDRDKLFTCGNTKRHGDTAELVRRRILGAKGLVRALRLV